MKDECRGCCLVRITMESHNIGRRPDSDLLREDQVSCEYDSKECPCKTCIVKSMCDIIEQSHNCEKFIAFNIEHSSNDFWKEHGQELLDNLKGKNNG